MPSQRSSLAEQLAQSPPETRAKFLSALTDDEARALEFDWRGFWARPGQLPPQTDWRYWLVMAGRGYGKTRVGAEWVIDQVQNRGKRRIALVAETVPDAREVMIQGKSGILACSPPWFFPEYIRTNRRLTWPNGAIATTYTAEKPDQLRGPQHDGAWIDELAKYRYPEETWDQLLFGMRLGEKPQVVITTTPRPIELIKKLIDDPTCAITRGSTSENRANLASDFVEAIYRKYGGTRLGRQELDAEMLDDAPGALWKRDSIEKLRVTTAPAFVRVVVAVDPNVSSDSDEAECGIVVAGLGEDGIGYVLDDLSLPKPKPEEWGREVVAAYRKHEADRIIGESNNGGDLVESNIRAFDRDISVRKVHASRSKQARAEPVASLYEQQRIRHLGTFPRLEDEMSQWEPGVSSWSPNRVDALVWAITELMLGDAREPVRNAYSTARQYRGRLPRARS